MVKAVRDIELMSWLDGLFLQRAGVCAITPAIKPSHRLYAERAALTFTRLKSLPTRDGESRTRHRAGVMVVWPM